MNSTIQKCMKPSNNKYQFIIFILLFILGTMIYIGYNLYYYESYDNNTKLLKRKKRQFNI